MADDSFVIVGPPFRVYTRDLSMPYEPVPRVFMYDSRPSRLARLCLT